MSRRSRIEIGRAVLRLSHEELVPLADLAEKAGVSERSLRRWAVEGKGCHSDRVYLDAVHNPTRGWLSSLDALTRFQARLSQ